MDKIKLFTPGPVNKETNIYNNISEIPPRSNQFSQIYKDINKLLNNILLYKNTDQYYNYSSVIFNGSGTTAIESIITSNSDKKILFISNGIFGDRWIDIGKKCVKNMNITHFEFGNKFDLIKVENEIKNNNYDAILSVHNETSCGISNPIYNLGQLCKKYRLEFFVDAVASIGCELFDIYECNITVCGFSCNKGLLSTTGLSIVTGKNSYFEKMKQNNTNSFYMDLYLHYKYFINFNQCLTTISTDAAICLLTSLKNITEFGIINHVEGIEKKRNYLLENIKKIGFTTYNENQNTNIVICLHHPNIKHHNNLVSFLEKKGIYTYRGKNEYNDCIIQISCLGIITTNDIDMLLENIKIFLTDFNI